MIVVCASIDPHRIVVRADHVELIGEHADAARDEAGATDVAELLGVTPPSGTRRALRVRQPRGRDARWLLVGDRVSVRQVSSDVFGALPGWLRGIREKLPLAGVVALEGAFAFELDVPRLLAGEDP